MIHEPQVNTNAYDRYFLRLRQASHIESLFDDKRVRLKLSLSHKAVYTYMLSMFNYYQSLGEECYLSSERVSAEVGISIATYRNVKRDLVNIGILYGSKRTSKNSVWLATHISYVVDVDCSPSHKYIKSAVIKTLDKAKWVKMGLEDEAKGVEVMSHHLKAGSWTSEQAINYKKNKKWEELSGCYLEGDLSACLLYDEDDYFERVLSSSSETTKLC